MNTLNLITKSDLTNIKFFRLLVIKSAGKNDIGNPVWLCKCDCGNEKIVKSYNLIKGIVKSCGCWNQEKGRKDMIGKRFGKLLVISKSEWRDDNYSVYWNCKCDCGNTCVVNGNYMRVGKKENCGCERHRRLAYGEAAFNDLLYNYKDSARKRGLSFELTDVQFRYLTSQKCSYCGCLPSKECHYVNKLGGQYFGSYIYNGIDRINNDMGYLWGNCKTACYRCNKSKLGRNHDDFINMIKNVYENLHLENLKIE